MTTMRADELQPGDRFPLGGIVRTITETGPTDNGDILIRYVPTGCLTINPATRFRNVTVGGITPIIINEGAS